MELENNYIYIVDEYGNIKLKKRRMSEEERKIKRNESNKKYRKKYFNTIHGKLKRNENMKKYFKKEWICPKCSKTMTKGSKFQHKKFICNIEILE